MNFGAWIRFLLVDTMIYHLSLARFFGIKAEAWIDLVWFNMNSILFWILKRVCDLEPVYVSLSKFSAVCMWDLCYTGIIRATSQKRLFPGIICIYLLCLILSHLKQLRRHKNCWFYYVLSLFPYSRSLRQKNCEWIFTCWKS